MGCKSYTGYNMAEICSSGLTHTLDENSYPGVDIAMDAHSPQLFKSSQIEMKYNYASLVIKKIKKDKIEIKATVMTLENKPLL